MAQFKCEKHIRSSACLLVKFPVTYIFCSSSLEGRTKPKLFNSCFCLHNQKSLLGLGELLEVSRHNATQHAHRELQRIMWKQWEYNLVIFSPILKESQGTYGQFPVRRIKILMRRNISRKTGAKRKARILLNSRKMLLHQRMHEVKGNSWEFNSLQHMRKLPSNIRAIVQL